MSGLEKLKEMLEKDLKFLKCIPAEQVNEKDKAFIDGKLAYYYFVMNLVNSLIDEEKKHNMEDEIPDDVWRRNKEMLESMPIDELQLTVRSHNTLLCNGITDLYMLTGLTREQLSGLKNLSRKVLNEIEDKLADLGLSLRKEED